MSEVGAGHAHDEALWRNRERDEALWRACRQHVFSSAIRRDATYPHEASEDQRLLSDEARYAAWRTFAQTGGDAPTSRGDTPSSSANTRTSNDVLTPTPSAYVYTRTSSEAPTPLDAVGLLRTLWTPDAAHALDDDDLARECARIHHENRHMSSTNPLTAVLNDSALTLHDAPEDRGAGALHPFGRDAVHWQAAVLAPLQEHPMLRSATADAHAALGRSPCAPTTTMLSRTCSESSSEHSFRSSAPSDVLAAGRGRTMPRVAATPPPATVELDAAPRSAPPRSAHGLLALPTTPPSGSRASSRMVDDQYDDPEREDDEHTLSHFGAFVTGRGAWAEGWV